MKSGLRGVFRKFWPLSHIFFKDLFKRHTIDHSKKTTPYLEMMLISLLYTISINSYDLLYITHSIPLTFFHVVEL